MSYLCARQCFNSANFTHVHIPHNLKHQTHGGVGGGEGREEGRRRRQSTFILVKMYDPKGLTEGACEQTVTQFGTLVINK